MENWTSIICCKINRLPLRIFLLLVFLMFNCGTGIFAIAVDQNDDDFTFKDNDIRKIQNPKINVLDQSMTGFTNVVLAGSDDNGILVNSQDGDGRSQEPLAESTRQLFDRLKRYVGDIFGGWLGGSPTDLNEPESSGSTIDGLKRTRFIRQAPKDNVQYIKDDDKDETGSGLDTLEGEDSGASIPPTMVTPLLRFTKGNGACRREEIRCRDGACIDSSKKCDNVRDCSGGEDELDCNFNNVIIPEPPPTPAPAPRGCGSDEFTCDNGHCIGVEPEGQLFLKAYPKEQIIKESQEVVFQCRDEGLLRAPITWTRSGEQLLPVNSRVRSNGRLEIPNIQLSQAGTYICKANEPYSRLPGSQISVELEVEPSSPSFVKSPESIELLTTGETFIINCSANGVPTPDIDWRFNREKVPAKCKTTNRNGTGTLTCPNIQREDEGIYSCIAINSKGSQFTLSNCVLTVKEISSELVSCPAHQFNNLATDPRDCIDCFCFGQSIECKSSNLSVSEVQVPLRGKSDQIVRIGFKSTYGEISVSSNGSDLISLQTTVEGDTLRVQWSNVSTYPYLDLSQDFSGNQIKSYGGYIRFNVKQHGDSNIDSPLIIISGNGRNIFYNTTEYFVGGVQQSDFKGKQDEIRARLFQGAWFREGNGSIELPSLATRGDIMRVIANVDHFFIKLQYSSSQQIDTLVSDIRIDTATARGTSVGPNRAVYVEECRCPPGYIGLSCERCDTGYRRIDDGNLGSCIAESCPDGQFGNPSQGIQCKDCPCPLSNPTNQFGRTCHLGACKKAVCHCPAGYSGRYCQFCAEGYTGDPLTPGSYCQPITKLNKYFANISSQFDWKTIEKEPKPWPPLNESHIKDAADKKHQIFINNLKRTFQSEFYPQKIHCEFSHENFSIITYKIYVTFEGTIYEGKMFTTFAANFDPITFNLTRSKDLKEYHIQHSNDAYKPVKLTSSPYNFSESLITEYIKNTSISIIHEILRQNSESFLQTDFCTLQKTSDNYTIQIPRLRAIDDGSSEWQNITIEGLFNYQSVNVMPHVGDDGIEVEVQFFTKTVTGSMVSSSNSTRFTFKIDRLLLKNNITEGTIYVEALDNILVDPPLPLSHNSKKELESIIANSIKNPPEVT